MTNKELIAEARRLEGDYGDGYEVMCHMSALADALEAATAAPAVPVEGDREALNVERENATAEYTRRNVGGMQPVMTVGERVHDAFVAGAEWQASRPFTEEDVEAALAERGRHQRDMSTGYCVCGERFPFTLRGLEDLSSHRMRAALDAVTARHTKGDDR